MATRTLNQPTGHTWEGSVATQTLGQPAGHTREGSVAAQALGQPITPSLQGKPIQAEPGQKKKMGNSTLG